MNVNNPANSSANPAGATDRYHRQTLLPQIGSAGQARLRASRIVVLGCGALGTVSAELLVRAGVGAVRLVDRDVVEWTNLQRQTLYDESDAQHARPKATAAATRLRAINRTVEIDAIVADADAATLPRLLTEPRADLVIDGTDNADTRYLLNDLSIKLGIPWVYGAAVGVEGRVMPIRPKLGPCLRCVFPKPPSPGELMTCDTAGVLGPATAIVGAMQAACAIRMLVDPAHHMDDRLVRIDAWRARFVELELAEARDPGCVCCARGQYDFLERPSRDRSRLCGRSAVQIAAPAVTTLDLPALARRLRASGEVVLHEQMLRFVPAGRGEIAMSIFVDARALVHGTTDLSAARSLYDRYVGR